MLSLGSSSYDMNSNLDTVIEQVRGNSYSVEPRNQNTSVNDKNSIVECHANIGHCDLSYDHYDVLIDEINTVKFRSDEDLKEMFEDAVGQEFGTDEQFDNVDQTLLDLSIKSIERNDEGRIILPLLWNGKTCNYLSENYNLAFKILKGIELKYRKDNTLFLMNEVIMNQVTDGVITRIDDLDKFRSAHRCAFLAHKPVLKLSNETTKCRIVYMSNFSEKRTRGPQISHNNAMLSGPCLNRKLLITLQLLRFDKYLLVFDLVKAFLQVEIPESDRYRLCFLWYKNIEKGDYTIVAYYFNRLPFGLKCSPCLLMIALYFILVKNTESDTVKIKELKRSIWDLFYVDNGAITANSSQDLQWAYSQLAGIFAPYQFNIQQCISNNVEMNGILSATEMEKTVKLFGIKWDTSADALQLNKLSLKTGANTKREVLQSLASNYDLIGISLPVLNRAKLFMQKLQCTKGLGWDDPICAEDKRSWKNITDQINNASPISIPRFVGSRTDSYELIVFTDSSQQIYGSVVYLLNLNLKSVSFIRAKNKLVSNNLNSK